MQHYACVYTYGQDSTSTIGINTKKDEIDHIKYYSETDTDTPDDSKFVLPNMEIVMVVVVVVVVTS